MRTLRRISAFICILLVIIVGFILLLVSTFYMTGLEIKNQLDDWFMQYFQLMKINLPIQTITLSIGLILLLVGFITSYLAIADIHSSGRIRLESNSGRLTVSISAIEDYLSRLGRNINGVKELRPRLRRTPTGWSLFVRASVWSEQNVQEINETIREEVRKGIYRIIGEHSIEPIDIHIYKIVDRGRVGSHRTMNVEFTA